MSVFVSATELQQVFESLFTLMSTDAEVGPKLRAFATPMRFVFSDLGLTLDVNAADDKRAKKGHGLTWLFSETGRKPKKPLGWEPVVTMTMTADVANRYFQGKENVPLSIARKIIVLETGDLARVLDLLPIVKPIHARWIAKLKADGLTRFVV